MVTPCQHITKQRIRITQIWPINTYRFPRGQRTKYHIDAGIISLRKVTCCLAGRSSKTAHEGCTRSEDRCHLGLANRPQPLILTLLPFAATRGKQNQRWGWILAASTCLLQNHSMKGVCRVLVSSGTKWFLLRVFSICVVSSVQPGATHRSRLGTGVCRQCSSQPQFSALETAAYL